ncbi:metal-dependent hydrolase [Sporomusa acidovorans]|uniref:metal-dependent hydrolase n=1 Tax=Sporomusa acidovorans TaxID=112900 RepID=UPI000B820B10
MCLVGSLLPDLIDKPVGILSAGNHIFIKSFGHSLFFLVLLYNISKLLRNNRHRSLCLTLWIGSILHDLFDLMWHFPKVLFWPVPLPNLPEEPYGPWGQTIYFGEFHFQLLLVLEFVGGFILLVTFIKLLFENRIKHFLKTGEISPLHGCNFSDPKNIYKN